MTVKLKHMDFAALHAEVGGYGDTVARAIPIACLAHQGQMRGPRGMATADPYIHHPLRVAARIARWGICDPIILAAAVLHDVAEDGPDAVAIAYGYNAHDPHQARENALWAIASEVGPEVADVVRGLSNPLGPAPQDKDAAYRSHVLGASRASAAVAVVKSSDLADNAKSLAYLAPHKPEKVARSARKYRPVIAAMPDVLRGHDGLDSGAVQAIITDLGAVRLPW